MKNIETIKKLLDQGLELESNVASIETVGGKTVFKLVEVPKEEPKSPVEPVKEPEIPTVPVTPKPEVPTIPQEPVKEEEEPPTKPIEEVPPVVEDKPKTYIPPKLKLPNLAKDADLKQQMEAIKNLTAMGQAAVYPSGTFVLPGELNMLAGSVVEGQGFHTELVLTPSDSTKRRVLRFEKRKANNVIVRNLKLNSHAEGHTKEDNHCVMIEEGVENVTFEAVEFYGSGSIGCVKIDGTPSSRAKNIQFIGCRFSKSGRSAIEFRGTNGITVKHCFFTEYGSSSKPKYSDSPAIQLQSVPCANVDISDNTFLNTTGTQFAIESANTWVWGGDEGSAQIKGKIVDNIFIDNNGKGGSGLSGYFNGFTIKNTFIGGIGHHRSGIELFGSNHIVEDNTIEKGNLVIASGHLQNGDKELVARNIKVRRNKVFTTADNCSAFIVAGARDKLGQVSIEDVEVTGNVFDNSKAGGGNTSTIKLGYYNGQSVIKNVLIEDNDIICNPNNRTFRLEALTGSENVKIVKNRLKGGDQPVNYKTDAIDNLVYENNTSEGQKKPKEIYYSVKLEKAKNVVLKP